MKDSQDHNSDPLAAILGPPETPSTAEHCESLVQQTSTVLRRRHHAKRVAYIVGLLVCYIGGVASIGIWTKADVATTPALPDEGKSKVVIEIPAAPAVEEIVTPQPKKPTAPTPEPETQPPETKSPTQLAIGESKKKTLPEFPSAYPGETRFEKYCRLGDELADAGKITSAVRAYKAALSFATDEEKRLRAEKDSWLLTSIKRCQ